MSRTRVNLRDHKTFFAIHVRVVIHVVDLIWRTSTVPAAPAYRLFYIQQRDSSMPKPRQRIPPPRPPSPPPTNGDSPTGGDNAYWLFRVRLVEESAKALRTIIVVGGALGIAFYTSIIVHDLAGKATTADIGLRFLGTLTISEGLAYAISALIAGVAYQKSHINKSLAKRLARLSEFEQSIDPNRSTSHLTETGVPREEDR